MLAGFWLDFWLDFRLGYNWIRVRFSLDSMRNSKLKSHVHWFPFITSIFENWLPSKPNIVSNNSFAWILTIVRTTFPCSITFSRVCSSQGGLVVFLDFMGCHSVYSVHCGTSLRVRCGVSFSRTQPSQHRSVTFVWLYQVYIWLFGWISNLRVDSVDGGWNHLLSALAQWVYVACLFFEFPGGRNIVFTKHKYYLHYS